MIEILEFIFQDFWHFLGALLLCSAIFGGIGSMFQKVTVVKREEQDDN